MSRQSAASNNSTNAGEAAAGISIPPETLAASPEKQQELLMHQIGSLRVEHFSGPLPPPHILGEYNKIVPGSGEILFDLAIEHQRQRIEHEEKVLNAVLQKERRGAWLGFALALAMMLLSAFAIYMGSDLVGFALIATSIVSLAGVFLYSHISARADPQEERAAPAQSSDSARKTQTA